MSFKETYGQKPIFGMIHLSSTEPVRRALRELELYEEEGLAGAIIENYHGETHDVIDTLKETHRFTRLKIGINILPNEDALALSLAKQYGASFVQLDHVAGHYRDRGTVNFEAYIHARSRHPNIHVLGGVHPKYYEPLTPLEDDLVRAVGRADAIVVTGQGTGKETPIEKILQFRETIGLHPLIVGAGCTPKNIYSQLKIADGAIVGSAFKPHANTRNEVDPKMVRDFMARARSR